MAEDLERRLFRTESTCLGRLTAETEHRPVKPRAYRTHTLMDTVADVQHFQPMQCPMAQTLQTKVILYYGNFIKSATRFQKSCQI